MKDTEMYETVCRERFDELVNGQKEVLAILRGRNGEAGLLDDMRAIKRGFRAVLAVVWFVLCAVGTQLIHALSIWLAGPK